MINVIDIYIYDLLFISSSICDSEWYRSVSWNIGTSFRKVSALYCNYDYYGFIYLTYFILITYYWVSMLEYIFSTKNKKQHIRGTIWHTGCEHCTQKPFEGKADRWYRDWFSVGIWPVLKWLSWSGTVNIQSYCDNQSLSYKVDRKLIEYLSLKSARLSLSSLSCSLTVQGKLWVEVITIEQSKRSLPKLVLLLIFLLNLIFIIFILNMLMIFMKL